MARPRVTLKLATTLDGMIALANGQSKWITGPQARAEVHRLRASHEVVLTGIGTVLADDPLLTARDVGAARQPLRVVLDTRGRLGMDSALVRSLDQAGLLVLHGGDVETGWRQALIEAGARPVAVVASSASGKLDLGGVFGLLRTLGVGSVMIEAGGTLAGAVLAAGIVDRIEWFRAPVVFGGDGQTVFAPLGLGSIAEAGRWRRLRAQPCGDDLWETYESDAGPAVAPE